jgi:hypothetical protein
MQFENVEEVVEETRPDVVNQRLADGWRLLAVAPGVDPHDDRSYICYVLGKVISNAEKAARIAQEKRESARGNEFLTPTG